jgi:hypothetical protein
LPAVVHGGGKGVVWFAALAVIAACTEHLVVRPEGEFSWEPQGQMVWPVDGAIVGGYRDSARPHHEGVDVAARPGNPVAAASAGRVTFLGGKRGFANVIALTHPDSLTTVYAHLDEVRVKAGDEVLRGQTIGTIGQEGYLHYEIRDAEGPVDPMKYYATLPKVAAGATPDVRDRVAAEPPELGALSAQPELAAIAATPHARMAAPAARTPSPLPTLAPTLVPTDTPTPAPTRTPTMAPTLTPTPTMVPTLAPTMVPTLAPTAIPTLAPTMAPTLTPTRAATRTPTAEPMRTPHRREPTHQPQPTQPPAPTPIPPTPVPSAESEQGNSVMGEIAFDTALAGTNLLYVPAKLGYAAIGTVIGGAVLVLAHDREVAAEVWWPSLGGDYFVSAPQLRGEEPIHFMGSSSETPEPPAPH